MENKPASWLVFLGKALNDMLPPICRKQVAQFSLQKKGCWQEGHLTVKKCLVIQNADQKLSAVAAPNQK